MPTYSRIATVTGGNKGIGLAIVRQLALQYPKSALNNGSLLIYLTARDRTRGEDALRASQNDAALKTILSSGGGPVDLAFHQLDVADDASVETFTEHLKKAHPEGIDIAINNAGIAMTGFDNNVVENTLRINYYGTLKMTRALVPLFKPEGGRLVNVSSIAGSLRKYGPDLRTRFLGSQTVEDVTNLMEEFKKGVANGSHEQAGWPSAAYAVSKAGVTGMTKVIAREVVEKQQNLLINACCPGYVKTDMTRGGGSKTPDQGAKTPVMLALGDLGGKYGEYWRDERVQEW